MSDEEVEGLFQRAGEAQNGTVGVNDLANLLQQHQLEGNLFKIIRRYDLLPFAHVLAPSLLQNLKVPKATHMKQELRSCSSSRTLFATVAAA